MYLYDNLNQEDKSVIIKLIEESEGEEIMLNAKRIIDAEIRKVKKQRKEARREGRAEGRAEGIIQGIKQTIQKMINMNLEDDFIKQATGFDKTEIDKIRKEMQARI